MNYTTGERFVGRIDEKWYVAEGKQGYILAEFRELGDALLAAASPSLYEALKNLLQNRTLGEVECQEQGLPGMVESNEMARKALSKAEGRG